MYNYGNVELGSLMTLAILAISGIGSHVVLKSALIFRDGKADDNRVCGTRDHTVMVDKTRLVGFVRPKRPETNRASARGSRTKASPSEL